LGIFDLASVLKYRMGMMAFISTLNTPNRNRMACCLIDSEYDYTIKLRGVMTQGGMKLEEEEIRSMKINAA